MSLIIGVKRSGPGAEQREAADKIFRAKKEAAAKAAKKDAEKK